MTVGVLKGTCYNLFSVAVKNIMTKSKLRRKGFILLILPHHSPSLKEASIGTQGRNLEAKNKVES